MKIRAFSAVLLIGFAALVSLGIFTVPARAAGSPVVLDNGNVRLGVNPEGNLVAPGGQPSPVDGTTNVGLRFKPTGNEGIAAGSAQESWGVADAVSGTTGSVNKACGNRNVSVVDFSATETTATSVVDVGEKEAGAPSFRVTHSYRPSTSPNLFRATVTIENTGDSRAEDVRYRRVVDWDAEPTPFDEFVTVGGEKIPALIFSSNEGFADQDPLAAPENWGASGFFADYGPDDLGALFDFGLGALEPGAKKTFTLFYGAAATETDALSSLSAVNAEVYSLAQPNAENGAKNTFILAFDMTPSNKAPIAGDDTVETNEDQKLTASVPGVLENDQDPEDDPITARLDGEPENGTLTLNEDGSFAYEPDADFNGTDSFTYRARDGQAESEPATATIAVSPINDKPAADDDTATTDEDTPVVIDVRDGDSSGPANEADQPLTVTQLTDPESGAAEVISSGQDTGKVRYVPDEDYSGSDAFEYTVCDDGTPEECDTATVDLTVTPVNDAPKANDDASSTNEDEPLTLGVLGNDTDPEGDALTVARFTQAENGSVECAPGGECRYTPREDFNGEDSFAYTAGDGNGGEAEATVRITVRAVNDRPVARDDSAETEAGKPVGLDVLGNDSDPDGDALTVAGFAQGADGRVECDQNGRCTYTPDADFTGEDAFTYTASDGNGGTATARVELSVIEPADKTPPDTSITSGPDGSTRQTGPTFSWSGSDDTTGAQGLEYSHRLDGGAWSAYSTSTSVMLSNLAEGSHTFYVKARDGAGNEDSTAAERSFTVDTIAPEVAGKTPAGGATGVPRNAVVSATFSEGLDPATVTGANFTLTKAGSSTAVPAVVNYEVAGKKAVLDPDESLEPETVYTATLRGGASGIKDAAGNPLAGNVTWSFTTADTVAPDPPTIDLDAASDTGASATDDLTNDNTPTLKGEAEGGSTVKVYDGEDLLVSVTASDAGTWSFTAPTLADGEHPISATATDEAGNTSGASSPSSTLLVAVDTARPAVADVAPVAGTDTAEASANATAAFSEKMDASTLTTATFTLLRSGTTSPVSAAVTYDSVSKTVTLDPASSLVAGAAYTATVKSGAKDLAGNTLASDKAWTFSVNSAPTVTNLAPASGGNTTDRTPNIKATVSDVQTDLAKSNITFYLDGNQKSTFAYDASTDRLSFIPGGKLAYGKHTVKVVARDPQGLVATRSWSFTVK